LATVFPRSSFRTICPLPSDSRASCDQLFLAWSPQIFPFNHGSVWHLIRLFRRVSSSSYFSLLIDPRKPCFTLFASPRTYKKLLFSLLPPPGSTFFSYPFPLPDHSFSFGGFEWQGLLLPLNFSFQCLVRDPFLQLFPFS